MDHYISQLQKQNDASIFSCFDCLLIQEEHFQEMSNYTIAPPKRQETNLKINLRQNQKSLSKMNRQYLENTCPYTYSFPTQSIPQITPQNNTFKRIPNSYNSSNSFEVMKTPIQYPIPLATDRVAITDTILKSSQTTQENAANIRAKPKLTFNYLQKIDSISQSERQNGQSRVIFGPIQQGFAKQVMEIPPKLINNKSSKEDQFQINSPTSVSPLNKMYRNSKKQMMISLELNKKSSSGSSNYNSQSFHLKNRVISSQNQSFGKALIKVREVKSIREPEEQSNYQSFIVESLLGSHEYLKMLLPIRETRAQLNSTEHQITNL